MTKEEIYKYILGQMNWKTMNELTPAGFMRATELLDKGEDPYEVEDAVDTLNRWGWFVKAGLVDEPPWGNPQWSELERRAPWKKK